MNRLVLFDVDRTLIGRSQCHHDAFSYAFKKVYNVDTDIKIINYGGMTDPNIAVEVLKKVGVDEDLILSKLDECMDVIVDYFQKNVKKDNIPILDGVKELLELLTEKGILLGLITGNLEPIAWGKLKTIDMDHYFKLGGFGSDSRDRTELVKIAVKKAENEFGFNGKVFVVGDTPRDIKAGKEANVRTVAVATGTYSVEELQNYGADFVFDNLKNKNGILKIVENV
jgi:phosphoglycolate phosphatase